MKVRMSFSSTVKNELCKLDIKDKCCKLSELSAVAGISGTASPIRIITENAAFARRIFSMAKDLFDMNPGVLIRKSKKLKKHTLYILDINIACIPALKKKRMNRCCKKAFLRGAFLAGGSVSDPEKTYHLEITSSNPDLIRDVDKLMDGYGLKAKIIERKGSFVLYIKEGENIVDFLNIIGAHNALLVMENIRILKGMRNNVNRIVNCETANLGKTVNASVRQAENIRYIRDTIGFERLTQNLREVAELRLLHNDAGLKELGEMLNPALGKSGVNHRLRKLDRIAESIRSSGGTGNII